MNWTKGDEAQTGSHAYEFLVKVRQIPFTVHLGDKGRGDSQIVHVLPVNWLKEEMAHDRLDAEGTMTEALLWIANEKLE